jgi:hypothetical protein
MLIIIVRKQKTSCELKKLQKRRQRKTATLQRQTATNRDKPRKPKIAVKSLLIKKCFRDIFHEYIHYYLIKTLYTIYYDIASYTTRSRILFKVFS